MARRVTPRRLVVVAIMGILALVGMVNAASGVPAQSRASLGMLVRLHQLRPGYRVEEEAGCSAISPEGADPALREFIIGTWPDSCVAEYERLYVVPGKRPDPPLVDTSVIDTRSRAGAGAAQMVMGDLVARLTGNIAPTEVPAKVKIGSETRLFHGGANVGGHRATASIYAWRQEDLIGVVLVGGLPSVAGDREAARVARLQRVHMRRPSPYPASQRDDLLVHLDNPAIKVPVYWLGRRFDAGRRAPLRLTSAYGPLREGEAPPGTRVELEYSEGALRIGTWTEGSWRRYTGTRLGKELLTWHCTKRSNLPLDGGQATIFRGYSKDYANCPSGRPTVTAAVAEIGDVVLGMNLPLCYSCLESSLAASELEAVSKALRLRPQRHFTGD